MKLSEVLCSVHIIEALTTRVDVQWSQDQESLIGVGEVEGVNFTLTAAPTSYGNYNGCNLSFATEKDGKRVETFRNEFGQSSSKIIGAVVNGFCDKLNDYEFDFFMLVAKNAVNKRASLYQLIANRFAKSQAMHVDQVTHGSHRIVLMIKHNIPLSVLRELQQKLDGLVDK